MSDVATRIAENLAGVHKRIAQSCERAGRDPASVQLVCVTKYAEPSWIKGLLACGIRTLGESRPQQLLERAESSSVDIDWHLVGHLQRNKVRRTLPVSSLIHSVDSLRLLRHIDTIADEDGHRPRVLLQVNVAREAGKDGFSPDQLRAEWPELLRLETVEVTGLMAMAAYNDDPQASRGDFAALRGLADELGSSGRRLGELSMGMSQDFEVAIEEGATLIRLGRGLYEGLTKDPAFITGRPS